MSERRYTAFHEGAHAVADHRLGFVCLGATIAPRGDTLGAAQAMDGWNDEQQARDSLTALYAGYCASIEAGEDEAVARKGADHDFEQADEVLVCLGAAETECLDVAFAFVREPSNWRAIELVAAELLLHEVLNGDEVAILVAIADGEGTRADLGSVSRCPPGRLQLNGRHARPPAHTVGRCRDDELQSADGFSAHTGGGRVAAR